MSEEAFDYDVTVIGSGFGGSVMALRLAEAGLRVVVLEQGGRVGSARIEEARESFRRFAWLPKARLFGYFAQHLFEHVSVTAGVGVGGGSLVYGAVLLRPDEETLSDPGWRALGPDAFEQLKPYFERAERMLGVVDNPRQSSQDRWLKEVAKGAGAEDTYALTRVGIHFAETADEAPDPYFGGEGPARAACAFCGECLGGCPLGAKNTLDLNYLYLAERLGAEVRPWHQADVITPLESGGYRITSRDPRSGRAQAELTSERVIVSAGVIGTLTLLLRCRDEVGSLPRLSARLGERVRTNSEAIVGVYHEDPPEDLLDGVAISSRFFPDKLTHITQNRFPPAYRFMRAFATPMAEGARFSTRLKTIASRALRSPGAILRRARERDWHEHVTVLTVMQRRESELAFDYAPSRRGRGGLRSKLVEGRKAPPVHLPVAAQTARSLAERAGGEPFDLALSSVANVATTAHILGGCLMGESASEGVIDSDHEVHHYPGLYVVDASAVPINLGLNPSLTIAAMAERAASRLIATLRR